MIGCLLCNRDISPFPIVFPNARGFERALLCRWHPRDMLDSEWFGLGPSAYWERMARLRAVLPGRRLVRAMYTPAYFSLLLCWDDGGLLLLYPQHRQAFFSFVPARLRAAGRPSGLASVASSTREDVAPFSPLVARGAALREIDFGRDAEGPDDRKLSLAWDGGERLTVEARGWSSLGAGASPDVDDLALLWG